MTNSKIQIISNKQVPNKFLKIGAWSLFVIWCLGFVISPYPAFAQDAIDPNFNPNLLISDEAFADSQTFGSAAAIQKFLELQGSVLANTTPQFVAKLKEPDVNTKVGLEDPEPSLDHLRTAAQLIYDASSKTGLNPQVLLVTLQKEQSLITGTFSSDSDLQTALDRALGFGCPDSSPCGNIFLGFYNQLFGAFDSSGGRYLGAASSLMKSFNNTINGARVGRGPEVDATGTANGGPAIRTSRKGDTINIANTLNGYQNVLPMQTVTLTNFATAALYRYTPHVFNGNYNFWKFYNQWFKYPNGTVIQKIGDTTTYVIDNGTKRLFSNFVAVQRKIKTSTIVPVSQTEFDSYITDKPMPPLDGTFIKGDISATVFLVQDGKKHAASGPVFAQHKYSFKNVMTLPQAEVDSYDTGSFIAPLDGTLITGNTDQTVYLIESGMKRPISYSVFKARKLSFKNLMKLSDDEVAGIGLGSFLTPPDGSAVGLAGDAGIYWYKDGQKRLMSAFVFKQRGVSSFPLVSLGSDEFNAIPTGTPLSPKDGTVIKGDQSTGIYKIQNGLKHLFTPVAYKRAGYPKATVLPQAEVDSYTEGNVISK